ncbi:hypothetical protein [Pseudomonas sp. LLC-1]|uniref:hypothetical protein n=1 Tax=Pseudomonas sp. LLC-1 TaxID=1812180 RepID=UPI0011B3835C|nr:hypothetical protein [Pseudomonas sp. LLC-1]
MHHLYHSIKSSIFWLLSVGKKITRTVPLYTAAVISATLISQTSLLIAYFLPLKVIILISSSSIPQYFPDSWIAFGHKNLVIALSIATVLFYFLHIISESIISHQSEKGAQRLITKSQKILLFSNQNDLAFQCYQRYSKGLAALIFILSSIALMAWVDPLLLSILSAFTALTLAAMLFHYTKPSIAASLSNSKITKLGNFISASGFLITFAYIVTSFLVNGAVNALTAVISILIVRQSFQRIASLTFDLYFLNTHRLQVNALFFHAHTLISLPNSQNQGFWSLLNESNRNNWIQEILAEVLETSITINSSRWHQTAYSDVAAIEASIGKPEHPLDKRFLLKLFNVNRNDLAVQEATVLAECKKLNLPALPLIGASTIQGLHCHVFEWHDEQKVSSADVKPKVLEAFGKLLCIEPPTQLSSRYVRSRPLLWQRLDQTFISRLKIAARDEYEAGLIQDLHEQYDLIQACLQRLPLQLINPDITAESVLVNADGKPVFSQWGRWSLDPIGASWPINPIELKQISSALVHARTVRASLEFILDAEVILSALMYAFEKACNRQQTETAIGLLPKILNSTQEIKMLAKWTTEGIVS